MENKVYGYGRAGDGSAVIGEMQDNLSIRSMHSGIYAFNCLRDINVLQKGEQVKVLFKVQPCLEKEHRKGTLQIMYGKPRIVEKDTGSVHKIADCGSIKITGCNW